MSMPQEWFAEHLQSGGVLFGTESGFPPESVRTLRPSNIRLGQCADGSPALEWHESDSAMPELSMSRGECLRQFVELHDAAGHPERVLQFAQTFGLLGMCEHKRAKELTLPGKWLRDFCLECSGIVKREPQTVKEPIDDWVYYADRFWLILIIVAAEKQGGFIGESKVYDAPLREQWELARRHIHAWMWHAFNIKEVTVHFDLKREAGVSPWSAHINGLQGLLAMELAAALTAPTGIKLCYACGSPYGLSEDEPGGYKYCSVDCVKAGNRNRSAKSYAKKRREQRESK